LLAADTIAANLPDSRLIDSNTFYIPKRLLAVDLIGGASPYIKMAYALLYMFM
jgi:hypothetical protein